MTVKQTYRHFLVQLQSIYTTGEASIVADSIFDKIAGLKRIDMISQSETPLASLTEFRLQDCLTQLLAHRPLQYVLGEAWFFRLRFRVNEQVLIPRPETEELVEALLADPRSTAQGISILDIGTGSGCIPVSLKKELPEAGISAVDISEAALDIARENALANQTEIMFRQLDFLNESNWPKLSIFDFIISNPPYIPFREKGSLAKNVVGYEPHLALFVTNSNPLIFYEKIARFGKKHLTPGGKIFVETHQDLARDVAAIFNKDYEDVCVKKDISGNERMVIALT